MKAIILARVSSKEQEDNNSIPAQTRRLNDYADRLGLEVTQTVQLVESSTKANRSKFNEIISHIKRSRETVALVTDTIDRLQRDFRESVMFDDLRRKGKIELHFMREGLVINQMSNSADILRWDMGVMFAKSYVTQLSDNVRRSQEEKLRNGEWLSKAPFGYTNIRREGKSWIEPDTNADIVRYMFKLYATGSYSMQRLGELITAEYGVRKSLSNIDKILKNPFYMGVMRVKGQDYAHRYDPIITRELYNTAQGASRRYAKQPFKYAGLPYLYRGIITCGSCGCRITPERSKGYIYYHCTQYKGKHGAKWLREEDITDQLVKAISAIHPTERQYSEVMTALRESHKDKIAIKGRQSATIHTEISKTDARLSRLYDSYLDGDISKEMYRDKNTEFKLKKEELLRRAESLELASSDYYDNAVKVMDLVKNAPLLFRNAHQPEEKRQILNMLFQNLELHGDQLRWKYKKPFDSMASYANDSSWLGLVGIFQEISQTIDPKSYHHLPN